MNRIKPAVSALALLLIVATGLRFRKASFIYANLYCFPSGQTVTSNLPCTMQPNNSNIPFQLVLSGGFITNPCPDWAGLQGNVFVQDTGTCIAPDFGAEYEETLE